MSSAPYGIRLLVGVAAIAIEETKKLPQTILMYPMTMASQFAHLVMKMQQDLADLVIKGDAALEMLFPPHDEQPEWATFDEDLEGSPAGAATTETTPRRTEGRFALYSTPEAGEAATTSKPTGRTATATATIPPIVADIGYEALTLAQLRARLQSLSVDDLEDLLAHEEATKSRAPFQTLLANRITRASAR